MGLQTASYVLGKAPSEYEIKAAYLYNFAQFVVWPNNTFKDNNDPIVIGILGDDPFGKALDDLVRDLVVDGRHVVVKRFARARDVGPCQVLFISQSHKDIEKSALEALKSKSVLTVGESRDFLKHGGIIKFTYEKRKIGLEVNLDRAKSENLKVSSKLLKIAKVVKE